MNFLQYTPVNSYNLAGCRFEKLQRIRQRTEEILSEAQAGFRPGRSIIDQIFTLRQLTEKYKEFGKELYVCYIDFNKAFDSVMEERTVESDEALWVP